MTTSGFLTVRGQEAGCGAVRPPLVSIVITNRNYAEFVGKTIDSVRQQDYPEFECLVVDDCSTDNSLEVINRHTRPDPRFRVIEMNKNIGPLSVAVAVLPQLRGNFVIFVDSDDILFPQFVSCHIQVHLALPAPVAFTSSDIIETDAQARAVAPGRYGFGTGLKLDSAKSGGLLDINRAVRLANVSEAAYRLLSDVTVMVPHYHTQWVRAPGSANVYRKSALERVLPPKLTTPHYSCDSHFIRLLHVTTGSAVINQPLSLYRNHDRNMYSSGPLLQATRWVRESHSEASVLQPLMVLRTYLGRTREFNRMLAGNRYWSTLDLLCNIENVTPRDYFSRPDVRRVLQTTLPELEAEFGLRTLIERLCERMSFRDVWTTLSASERIYIFLPFLLATQLRTEWQKSSAALSRVGTAIKRRISRA